MGLVSSLLSGPWLLLVGELICSGSAGALTCSSRLSVRVMQRQLPHSKGLQAWLALCAQLQVLMPSQGIIPCIADQWLDWTMLAERLLHRRCTVPTCSCGASGLEVSSCEAGLCRLSMPLVASSGPALPSSMPCQCHYLPSTAGQQSGCLAQSLPVPHFQQVVCPCLLPVHEANALHC